MQDVKCAFLCDFSKKMHFDKYTFNIDRKTIKVDQRTPIFCQQTANVDRILLKHYKNMANCYKRTPFFYLKTPKCDKNISNVYQKTVNVDSIPANVDIKTPNDDQR